MPTITPTPTDATVFLSGHYPQPANPFFFVSIDEAKKLKADLVKAGICPDAAKIMDVSYGLGPVIYGSDGRYVLGFHWDEVDQTLTPPARVTWEIYAGPLYWRWLELPNGTWQRTAGNSVWRA